jgi:arylformamidase
VLAVRGAVTVEKLARSRIRRGERILLKTDNARRPDRYRTFWSGYVSVPPDAAAYLAERAVRLVGIDYLSIGAPGEDGDATHRILLEAGVWILESLVLDAVAAGRYELVCLPLKIAGGDGAPARAFLKR